MTASASYILHPRSALGALLRYGYAELLGNVDEEFVEKVRISVPARLRPDAS